MPDDPNDLPDFGPQTRLVARLATAVDDTRLDGPTPCPDYAVRHLLGHIAGLTVAFADAGRKRLGPTTDTDPTSALPDLGADWREQLPRLLDELAEVWRDPAAWTGGTRAGGVELTGDVAGAVALNELVVHGWDLARATGQEYAPDEASLAVSYAMVSAATVDPADTKGTLFGPPLPVRDDAPLLEKVVALSGRDPSWRP